MEKTKEIINLMRDEIQKLSARVDNFSDKECMEAIFVRGKIIGLNDMLIKLCNRLDKELNN